ncbi:MAG: signal peptidase I [Flavobacteriales bacterium]
MSWTTWLIIIAILQTVHFLGTWKLYLRAGRKAWEAAILVYSIAVWLKIINRPMWWCFIPFLPIIGPIMLGVLWYDTPKSFGKSKKESILAVVTLGFYLFYLNYADSSPYQKIENDERKETLVSAILYAVVVATFVHIFVIQPFIIPTGSMEKTLLVGDGLFVNKWTYGYRIPQTPVGIPFLSNYIPYTGNKKEYPNGAVEWKSNPMKNYVDGIRLPYKRIAQFKDVKANDIVVFNYPADSLNTATDRKDPYVKRCIGTPGTTLEIKKGIVYIDGKEFQYPKDTHICHSYEVFTSTPLNTDYIFNDLGFANSTNFSKIETNHYAFYSLTHDEAKILEGLEVVKSISRRYLINSANSTTSFPSGKKWHNDQYGPLYIPKKGDQITLTNENIEQYRDIITKYEGNTLETQNGTFIINGQNTNTYTLQQDYYFMMGDNRHNSLDSRYFGYVPFDHIIGSPVLTWMSIDLNGDKMPRWNRFMTIPNNGNPDKPSYLWLIGLLIVGYFVYSFIKKKKEE